MNRKQSIILNKNKENRDMTNMAKRKFNFRKYGFLLEQLVQRDFKVKYRRSYLGMVWSLLNPLLMMSVQYIVFSSIFKSNIENFLVYLLAGITMFNFVSEASNNALISITGNAALITKVYLPLYIFPIAKVLSSSINLFLSMIPMLVMVAITGAPINIFTPLIFVNLFLALIFCIGLGFVLSTLMTLFRDVQFLWTIVLLIWMYATPIFYPVSIIPVKYSFIFNLNPLYHFITASRTILIGGVPPSLQTYLILIFISFSSFFLGGLFFVMNQDRFIHHL